MANRHWLDQSIYSGFLAQRVKRLTEAEIGRTNLQKKDQGHGKQ